jgi:hypothetical protein
MDSRSPLAPELAAQLLRLATQSEERGMLIEHPTIASRNLADIIKPCYQKARP